MTNIIEIINQRRSVRTFDTSRFVGDKLLSALNEEINRLCSPWACGQIKIGLCNQPQECKPQKLGKYGIIAGARNFMTVSVAADAAAEVAAGEMAEKLILWLTDQGLGTVWVGGVPKREEFAAQLEPDSQLTLAAIIPFGYAAKPRLVERMLRFAASASSRKPFETLFFRADAAGSLSPLSPAYVGEDMAKVLEAVRRAPSSFNGQPWRMVADGNKWYVFGEYKSSLGTDDLRMKHLDMGIALCHFEVAYKAVVGARSEFSYGVDAPGIATSTDWHAIATIAL